MAEYHLPTASLLGSELQGTAMVLLSPGWSLTSNIGAVTASRRWAPRTDPNFGAHGEYSSTPFGSHTQSNPGNSGPGRALRALDFYK